MTDVTPWILLDKYQSFEVPSDRFLQNAVWKMGTNALEKSSGCLHLLVYILKLETAVGLKRWYLSEDSLFVPEDKVKIILRNVGNYILNDTALQSERYVSWATLLWKPKISHGVYKPFTTLERCNLQVTLVTKRFSVMIRTGYFTNRVTELACMVNSNEATRVKKYQLKRLSSLHQFPCLDAAVNLSFHSR